MRPSVGCNRFHELSERAARWLLTLQDRTEVTELAITHEFLAQMLGVQRPTVTIAIGTLERAGLLEQMSRGHLRIAKREALEAAALLLRAGPRFQRHGRWPVAAVLERELSSALSLGVQGRMLHRSPQLSHERAKRIRLENEGHDYAVAFALGGERERVSVDDVPLQRIDDCCVILDGRSFGRIVLLQTPPGLAHCGRDERWAVAALAFVVLLAVLAPLAWAQSRVTYRLDAEALTVRVGFQRRRLPYGRIRDVRRLPDAMPTLGNRPFGVVEVNATARFPTRITPSDPDAFTAELQRRMRARAAAANG